MSRFREKQKFEPMFLVGILVTAILHVGSVVGILIYRSRTAQAVRPPPPPSYVVAKLIRKGVKKPKKKLPDKIVPRAETIKKKAIDINADADAAPNKKKRPDKPRAKLDDKQREALKKLQALAKAQRDIEQEGDPKGVRGGASNARDGDRYMTRIADLWNRNWSLPAVIPRDVAKKLNCYVTLTIDKTGKITNVKIDRSSGNQHFDSSIKLAWARIKQLPIPPPDRLASYLAHGLRFRLNWRGMR
ncbi:MAG: TonB family protein [Myxococcales bacterium]|nr:TonB family protein [Myxococcales bacterium]